MAKKLYVGNYTFDASEQTVSVSGNIAAEKFLIITNISSNTIIYNFADPTLGYAGKSYDIPTDKTEFSLVYDTTSMNDTDVLQIFVDQDYQEITPAEDLLDPVGKLRVSNPENLIDTDFEYSLQGTKWETLQTVNNIPTVYSSSGDIPIEGIQSVEATTGSRQIRVSTNIVHNLNVGDPISVQGLDLFTAEGFFIVSATPDSTTFFYEIDSQSTVSGDISGSYTNIIAAKFFEGSPLPISIEEGAITDGASPSNITVTTTETHGFTQNTKLYVRNTVGPKTLVVDDSSQNAPDGRPIVDTVVSFSTDETISTSTDTLRGTFRTPPIVSYDWESTHTRYFTSANVDTAANTLTWTSHGMQDKYTVLFNTPQRETTIGGLVDGRVYYVEVIDSDTIKLHTSDSINSEINITTWDTSNGLPRLGLVYKIFESVGTTRTTQFAYEYTSGTPTQSQLETSGSDLYNSTYGLGAEAPSRLVAFQGEQSGSSYNEPSESYSNLTNQVDRGRYGTTNPFYNSQFISNSNGTFTTDFNNTSSFTQLSTGLDYQWNRNTGSPAYPSNASQFDQFFDGGSSVSSFGGSGVHSTFISWGNGRQSGGVGRTTSRMSYLPESYYSWQVEGLVLAPETGTYQIGVDGDDAIDVFINGQLVAYWYGGHGFSGRSNFSGGGQVSGQITLQAGQYYSFKARMQEAGGGDGIQVAWRRPSSGSFELIPGSAFFRGGSLNPGSEIFYSFARTLSNDRNTIYIPNHGIPDGSNITMVVDSTDYAAGQRFKFANSSGVGVELSNAVISGTANVVSNDLIRMQLGETPFTDDIIGYPDNFDISYQRENEFYNSIYIQNHKIAGTTEAVYDQIGTTAIGGITDGGTYLLSRVNDSRISISNTSTSTTTATTAEAGANNNNTITQFIDFESALGFAPQTASILEVQFRGDFSSSREYVLMKFGDNQEFYTGQNNGQDTSVWLTDNTWSIKNVSELLTTNASGNYGINVEFDPTSQVNFSPLPSGNYWEIRFVISADSGSIILSSTGQGEQQFQISNQIGAYDGIYNINSIAAQNEFTTRSEFNVPVRSYSFDTTDISGNTIEFTQDHNLITGEKVVYDENGNTAIFPASDAYYVIVIDNLTISLASSYISALSNTPLVITNQTGTHLITSANIVKSIAGGGTMTIEAGTREIVGDGTRFLTDFKRFDNMWIETNGFAKEFTIDQITTNETMTIFETPTVTTTGARYYFATQFILRPDGFAAHKSFDGGVDITAGTSPNSKIVRQSRKYFRYQSGKGIQNSFAINFNPPKIVQNLIQATGKIATVNTQEPHNFAIGDPVRIEKSEVTQSVNYYNGEFTVAGVIDEFTFQYEMSAIPAETRAGGYPTYTRVSWNDSYVRAGMFDDQNGFLYEFDGSQLYAVRRSSTQQLAGSVNTSRGSQVITGNSTSFTSQIEINDKIVIRGQSYKVVEVSSDARLVVQPAYRGVTATKVKITRTVDTRVPQNQWNIDKCDGNGPHGYILDLNRIQMAYADYSWYGAGKVRFGFKDQNGHVRYCHEFKHNNILDESYFRSGNLPARYEIENGPNASTAPTLFHFGTSIMMDGTFDDDKAYLFSSSSKPFAYTNGASRNVTTTANSSFQLVTIDGSRVFVYAIPVSESEASATAVGSQIAVSGSIVLPNGTYITQVKVDGANSLVYTSWPATATEPSGASFPDIGSSSTLNIGEQTAIPLDAPIPLVSLRLAPSVDSGLTGLVGEREIINRMQLGLRNAGVTSNTAYEVFLILNAIPSNLEFINANSPSLSQLIKHNAGDSLINGTTIFSQKSSAGSVDIDLTALLELGNSIQGGDGIFPGGPDLLTLAVQPQDTSEISGATPFFVSGKINWSESQA